MGPSSGVVPSPFIFVKERWCISFTVWCSRKRRRKILYKMFRTAWTIRNTFLAADDETHLKDYAIFLNKSTFQSFIFFGNMFGNERKKSGTRNLNPIFDGILFCLFFTLCVRVGNLFFLLQFCAWLTLVQIGMEWQESKNRLVSSGGWSTKENSPKVMETV